MVPVKGLTLVELMVVVAVMAVIAAIAYPLYTNQVQKSRRADARVALQNIVLAQERFYTANGMYTTNLGSLQVSTDIQGGTTDQGYYTIANPVLANGGQSFTVTVTKSAGGPQSGDNECATFSIDNLGTKTSTGGGTNCW